MNSFHKNPVTTDGCHTSPPKPYRQDIGMLMREIAVCRKSNKIATWQKVNKRMDWEKIPPGILRTIALMVYRDPYGSIFIESILLTNALHDSDIEMISHDTAIQYAPTLIESLVEKINAIRNKYSHPLEKTDKIVSHLRIVRVPFISDFEPNLENE